MTHFARAALCAVIIVTSAFVHAHEQADTATLARIRSEALERSKVLDTFNQLANVIGPRLTNSPEHLASFRGAAPIVEELLTLALRLRLESPRLGLRTFADGTQQLVEGDIPLLADVTISGEISSIGLSYALGIRNIFDWQYRLPGGEDIAIPFLPQPGRSVYFETALRF